MDINNSRLDKNILENVYLQSEYFEEVLTEEEIGSLSVTNYGELDKATEVRDDVLEKMKSVERELADLNEMLIIKTEEYNTLAYEYDRGTRKINRLYQESESSPFDGLSNPTRKGDITM